MPRMVSVFMTASRGMTDRMSHKTFSFDRKERFTFTGFTLL